MNNFMELLVWNLEEGLTKYTRGYMPKEGAYEMLKDLTGQDFGYDSKAWRKWLKKNDKNPYREGKP